MAQILLIELIISVNRGKPELLERLLDALVVLFGALFEPQASSFVILEFDLGFTQLVFTSIFPNVCLKWSEFFSICSSTFLKH